MASSPSSTTGYLHNLCRQGNVSAIRPYLQGISDINKLEERVGFLGYTPLHEATNQGQTSVVRLLLLYGANANAKANGFYTPLHIAASMDNLDCVAELLKHNADITSKDEFGKTPYETAVIHKCKKSARVLKSEEVKKAARENSPTLRELLTSIRIHDLVPSCFKEALLEASRGGHMDAVCSLIITGGRHSLQLKDCISEALKFHYCDVAAMLLTCYAAKHNKKKLLKYLMSLEMSEEEKQEALSELPNEVTTTHDVLARIRSCISDKDSFHIAVPIGLAIQQRKKEAVGIILLNTNCNQAQKRIDWPKLALGDIDPSWLENVTWVEKLFLASNLLTSIPSNINILSKLCTLDLRKNQLRTIPASLLQMSSLRDLKLSENKIVELPRKCKWSPSLKILNLNDNALETLPKSMAQAKLSILYLARNNLYEVPLCICQIITLQSLDLSGNPRLTQLPPQMGRLTNIEMLKLENLDQLTDPPEEIKRNGIKTISYLRNILRRSEGYYTMKLMLVGKAAQGKTTLKHRLMKDYSYNINSSTNGIAMDEFRYNRKDFGLFPMHQEFVFKIWDFGGQEDFYTTHQCFLSTLALYLLVWNLEEGESGIEMLKSWLDTISASASNTSLIIVGTHLDKVKKNKEPGFQERMRELVMELVALPKYNRINVKDIKEVSCAPDNREGIDDLRVTIYDVARGLQKSERGQVSVMGEKIPHSFLLVADVIQAKRQELRNNGQMPIMHKSAYEALVLDTIKNDTLDIEDTNDLVEVTQFMHERGILMHYDDPNQDLQDLYFIDPQWLCELMAQIVTLPEVNPYIRNGILNLDDLPQIFKGELFAHQNSPQFIRLLNRFQIACSLDENRVLIPSKLPDKQPDEATNDDLPFITLKRIHSLPCIPFGFWSRLISRLLFYMKDMLSGGENFTRQEYTSPFQLDPFCCRCPLVLESSNTGSLIESENEMLASIEASIGGSFENLQSSPGDFRGLVRFFSSHRQGTYINGRFFGYSDIEGGSSRSDSGFEYSSDDDDDARVRAPGSLNSTFPLARSRDTSWRKEGVFKHGTHPGIPCRNDEINDLESGTPKSDSALPILRQNFLQGDLDDLDGKAHSGSEQGSPEQSYISPDAAQGSSVPDNEPLVDSIGNNDDLVETPRCEELVNGEAYEDIEVLNYKETSLESCPERLSRLLDVSPSQNYTSDDSDSVPYHSATSRSCTPDPFPRERSDGHHNDPSPTVPSEDPEIRPVQENPTADDPNQFQPLTKACSQEADNFNLSFSEGHFNVDSCEVASNHSASSSVSNSISSDKEESSGESFHTGSSRGSSDNEAGDASTEIRTLHGNEEVAAASHASGISVGSDQSEAGEDVSTAEISSHDSLGTTFQSPYLPPEMSVDSPEIVHLGTPPVSPDPGRSTTAGSSRGKPRSGTPHLPYCPFIEDFPIDSLPQLPTDLATLIDHGFLHCWKSGVCLRHPRLFFLSYGVPDPASDRQLIITEASPCPQGRRVLSYVVDHIDTLIREWYQEYSSTDGQQPKVRQLIPCVVCERLGLEPYKFSFAECQFQSSTSDTIPCPHHPRLKVNLHQVAPDIMLHDVDADLLLSHEEIKYEDTESSMLGEGGFGKVFRGECRGQAVAIKFYIRRDESEPLRHYREVRKELNVLRRVRQHPFLINIIGVSLRPLCLVLELAERGALTEITVNPIPIHRIVLFRIAYQVADALRFLHDLGVIYRDLKPENVLVWSLDEHADLHVKLIDFGTANFATSTGLVSVAGSPGNHAPEMLECANKEEYTPQVDVYSYAILLYQIITRLVPFEEYDSGPKINAAVIAGERPTWQHVPVTAFGLPTLTELMLRCWSGKPTKRPTSAQIAEQVSQPAFQCLLAKQAVPSEQQSVRHACLVPDSHELWLACDGHTGNRIFIYDGRLLNMKFSFSIETDQELALSFQIQCMHFMAPFVLIAVRGPMDQVNVYSTSSDVRYKCVTSMAFNEQISCVTSNDEYIFVGLNDGRVRCVLKSEMKKSDKKRAVRSIPVGRHRILSLTVAQDKLWVSTSRYIFRYFTKPGEMDAFDIDAMWYGGPSGMENNPQTQVSLLKVCLDGEGVLSVCRSVLSKWDVETRQNRFNVDCAAILKSLAGDSTEDPRKHSGDSAACITCVEPTHDSLWVGIASGHILIFDSETGHLLTWFHPFDETRTLTLIYGPGPCGTEQSYVISTGKGLRPEGLGRVCVLSAERVREPPPEITSRKASEPERKKTYKRPSSARKLRSPTPPFEEPENDAVDANPTPQPKCSMIMWEVVSKSCFARIEAKSGRQPIPFSGSTNSVGGEEPSQNIDESDLET
ncbi:leucine-rich repeat serine/threonine-protein kinase 2-like isoform X1 [Oculina patagonica]